MLSPDDTHVFVLVAERPAGARNIIVPNYVNETGYTEDIPGRTAVGDAQNRTLLAMLNLKTGKTAWADGSFAPPIDEPAATDAAAPRASGDTTGCLAASGKKAEREIRWSDVSRSARRQARRRRGAIGRQRRTVGTSRSNAETGKTRVVDTLHDEAWIREAGAVWFVRRRVPAQTATGVVPVGARRVDAPLHARRQTRRPRRRSS